MADYTLSVKGQSEMDDIVKDLNTIKNDLGDVSQAASKAGSGFSIWRGALANMASSAIISGLNTVKSAVTGIANGLVDIGKAAYQAGADLEQNIGGAETLYGDAADEVKRMAQEAAGYGVNMNDYLEMTNSYAAALKQAFAGSADAEAQAAKAADLAIKDMADNSAKMGTDIQSIQTAYAGFAKQNYTMLDNLKLGYGGTKQEMERLLADAEKLSGVHYDIDNLADVYNALHVIQENLGLTGVAAAEASETMSGSWSRLKSTWENTLGDLALGNDLTEDMKQLGQAAKDVAKNALPTIKNILENIPDLIEGAFEIGGELLDGIFEDFSPADIAEGVAHIAEVIGTGLTDRLPQFLEFGGTLAKKLGEQALGMAQDAIKTLISKKDEIIGGIKTFVTDAIDTAGQFIQENAGALIEGAGDIINGIIEIGAEIGGALLNAVTSIDWLALGTSLAEGIKTFLSDALSTAGEFISTNAGTLITDALGALADIGTLIGEALGSAGDLAIELVQWLSDAIQDINWKDVADGIRDAIANTVNGAIDAAGKLLGKAGDILDAIKGAAGSAADFAFALLGDAADLATSIVQHLLNAIEQINWGEIRKGLTDTLTGIFTAWTENKDEIFDKIKNFIYSTIYGIGDYLTNHGDELLENVLGFLGDAAAIAVRLLGDAIVLSAKIFQWIGDAIINTDWLALGASLLEGLLKGLASIAESLLGAFADLFAEVVPTALQAMLDFPARIILFLDGIILSVIEKGAELVQGLLDGIGSAIGAAADWIAEKFTEAVDFIISLPEKAIEWGAGLIKGFLDGLKEWWQSLNIGGWIEEKFDEATQFIKDLPEKALNWGRDLISGFFDGISEKWNNLKGGINDIAGWIGDRLGFSVPKYGPLSDFDKSGGDMVDVFADGIKKREGYLFNTIDNLAGTVNDSLAGIQPQALTGASQAAAYTRAPAANTFNYGGINMTVNGAQGQSEDYLADKIIDLITARLRQEGAVFA